MKKRTCLAFAALMVTIAFTLCACRTAAPVASPSSAAVSEAAPSSSQEPSSSVAESSSEVVSSEVASSETPSSSEASSSKAVSSKAASSKAASSKAASSKAASSSKGSSSAYVGMKEKLTTDSDYTSSDSTSSTSGKPFFYMVYKVKGTDIITFYMQNAGSCRVNNAVLTDIISDEDDATATVSFSGTSVTVNPNELGRYGIEITVENPTDGETYVFTTVVVAQK